MTGGESRIKGHARKRSASRTLLFGPATWLSPHQDELTAHGGAKTIGLPTLGPESATLAFDVGSYLRTNQ
jgi:hypothetical protein